MNNKKQNVTEIPTQMTVHIVDDDEAVRDAIGMLLTSIGIENVSYPDAQTFLQAYQSPGFNQQLGCIVLDIRMPVISGIECQHKLVDMGCTLPIIFITGHGDVPMAVEAMKKGASEFIQKPFREQELIDSIQKALQTSECSQQKIQNLANVKTRLNTLTPRENQILAAMIEGKANKVMAIDLHLSQRTVEIHRARVMEKMQADSLAHLIRMVLDAS